MTGHQSVVLLLDLGLVLLLARLVGALARRFDLPAVIGEILAGILVGPTFFHGAIAATLFPTDVRPLLSAVANVGVALFMFLVGYELDARLLRGRGRAVLTVSAGSVLLPLGLGVLLATYLARGEHVANRTGFVLFLGVAMSVTAFPVLARILADRGMNGTRLGGLALASAAVGDVVAWSLLALVVVLVGGNGQAPWHLLLLVPFLGLVLLARLLLRRTLERRGELSTVTLVAVAGGGLLLCGAATEWMGLHFIFGAFLFGLAMPRGDTGVLRDRITAAVQPVSVSLLLPVYFVVAGLKVDLSGVGLAGLGVFGLVMLVAVGGKFVGVFLAARVHAIDRRRAATLAALMNSRGLTELVVLTTGLSLGLLSDQLYSLLVLMAVVTTAMAAPLLRLWYPKELLRADIAQVREPALQR